MTKKLYENRVPIKEHLGTMLEMKNKKGDV